MPIECMNNIKLRKIVDFEDLCKAIQVDNNGKPHKEIKIFVLKRELDLDILKINK